MIFNYPVTKLPDYQIVGLDKLPASQPRSPNTVHLSAKTKTSTQSSDSNSSVIRSCIGITNLFVFVCAVGIAAAAAQAALPQFEAGI